MKEPFIAGNWKDKRRDLYEMNEWVDAFQRIVARSKDTDALHRATIVVCAPYPFLSPLKERIDKHSLPLFIGAQDISELGGDEKPVTGEVTGHMLRSIGVTYVIIGHSERRNLGETDPVLAKKVEQATHEGLKVIYCVPDETTAVPHGVDVIAYEPVRAIGTGKAEPPEDANAVISRIKEKTGVPTVIYGGSVTDKNVAEYIRQPAIDGILPGGASLDAETFFSLIVNGTPA